MTTFYNISFLLFYPFLRNSFDSLQLSTQLVHIVRIYWASFILQKHESLLILPYYIGPFWPFSRNNKSWLLWLEMMLMLCKVMYPKYSKHLPYFVAHTIDCVGSKMLSLGLNHGLFLSLFKNFVWKYISNWFEKKIYII